MAFDFWFSVRIGTPALLCNIINLIFSDFLFNLEQTNKKYKLPRIKN